MQSYNTMTYQAIPWNKSLVISISTFIIRRSLLSLDKHCSSHILFFHLDLFQKLFVKLKKHKQIVRGQCCLTFVSRLRFLTVDSSESFIWLVSDLYKHSLGYWVVWGRGHLRNGDYCSESSITQRLPFRHGGSTQTVRRRRLIKRESGSSGRPATIWERDSYTRTDHHHHHHHHHHRHRHHHG